MPELLTASQLYCCDINRQGVHHQCAERTLRQFNNNLCNPNDKYLKKKGFPSLYFLSIVGVQKKKKCECDLFFFDNFFFFVIVPMYIKL